MAKRIIQKKILYLQTLLGETKGFFKRLQIRYSIWNEECKLKKYK
jgi:plasmid maintenance system antidote protein VapI